MRKDLLIILLLILPAFSQLIRPGFFPMHDDLQTIRQLEMNNCIEEGQIPCRWSINLGNGYGYPLFNYYPPLPYYFGYVVSLLNIQFIDVVKIVASFGFIFSALFMYLLGKELRGGRFGIFSAVMYTYAPYHSVDLYVRGAMNEFYALVFFPLILLSILKVVKNNRFDIWTSILALSISGLMLSHNPMLMIFAPVALVWSLYCIWEYKNIKSLLRLSYSGVLGLGISAFFTLPVLFEQKYVHVETLVIGYFNYLAHFADLKQLFLNINWGYGGSGLGPDDGMSFALGYLHWILPVLTLFSVLLSKKQKNQSIKIVVLFVILLGSLFMTHSRSSFIWNIIRPLEYLQFPWRFLAISIFSASLLSGYLSEVISKKALILVMTSIVLINGIYFTPQKWDSSVTDEIIFSGKSWEHLITGSIYDYLPKDAPLPPANKADSDMKIILGSGTITTDTKRSNLQYYYIQQDSPGKIQLQTFFFPGWRYYLNGTEIYHTSLDSLLGRPEFEIDSGKHSFTAKFTNTPIRTFSNISTIISWFILVLTSINYLARNKYEY